MALVADWRQILSELPEDWADARLLLTADHETEAAHAASLLSGASPHRRGKEVRLYAGEHGLAPTHIERLMQRLDRDRVAASLTLESAGVREQPEAAGGTAGLAPSWDAELEGLPPDWSDAYAEVELVSSDHLDRAALHLSPANAQRVPGTTTLRFRAARNYGYGVSPQMARRALERIDADGIPGEVRVLRVLSDTRPVYTQGPVWYAGGRVI